MNEILIFLIIGCVIGTTIARLWYGKSYVPAAEKDEINNRLQETITRNAILERELENMIAERIDRQLEYTAMQNKWEATTIEAAGMTKELQYARQQLETQKEEVTRIGEKFEAQFKILASSILEDKAQKFNEQQEQGLKAILEPLKQHIQTFKQEFETKFITETKDRSALGEQIKQMMAMNQQLASQANSLTEALRGSNKQQGNWGEMILERILEYAGLQKNTHYYVQQRSQNAEGQTIQPDVIVRYPDSRAIVIDSKVSLVHYEQYCATEDEAVKGQTLGLMVRSIKGHIDGLSGKSYHDVTDALDMVMMFVPVEGAYITAIQADNTLWQYAYNKRVVLISPTNLIAAMKLVSDMWQRDGIDKNAQRVAELAGRLYDKLVGYVENMARVGDQINKAHDTWEAAYKQLATGRGNMVSLAEQMKRLNAVTNKSLPEGLTDEALAADRMVLPEDES